MGSSAKPYILGIDPGLSGAIAVVNWQSLKIIAIKDLPTFKTKSKARKQGYLSHIDVHALAMLIDFYAKDTLAAVLEDPGAMPSQGLSSTFRFGQVCGQVHGVLAGNYLPSVLVKPQVWKPQMGLTPSKNSSLERVMMLFPDSREYFSLKKHHDRAEAVLLAVYGIKHMPAVFNHLKKGIPL